MNAAPRRIVITGNLEKKTLIRFYRRELTAKERCRSFDNISRSSANRIERVIQSMNFSWSSIFDTTTLNAFCFKEIER